MSEVTISRSEYSRLKKLSTLGVKVNNELTAKLQQADKDKAELIALISVARCPACDGSGSIPHQVQEDEWEAEQCQWCYEVEAIAAKHKEGK